MNCLLFTELDFAERCDTIEVFDQWRHIWNQLDTPACYFDSNLQWEISLQSMIINFRAGSLYQRVEVVESHV